MTQVKEEAKVLSDVFGSSHQYIRITNADIDDFSLNFTPPNSNGLSHYVKASFMLTASSQTVMWYCADDGPSTDPRMDTVLQRANDFQGTSFKASFYNLIRLVVDLWGLPSVEPDIQRVEAILSEVVLGRRRAGDSGAGSEVSSVEMNLDANEGDGTGAADVDAADEMMIDDMDDIFKPVSAPPPPQASSSAPSSRDVPGPSSSAAPFANVPSGPFDLDMSGVNDGEREIINKILKRRFDSQTKSGASKHTGSVVAVNRLLRELNSLYKSQGYKDRIFIVQPDEADLYQWTVKIYKMDLDSHLWRDLQKLKGKDNTDCIEMIFYFNDSFPFSPPFVRLVYPVITHGHVLSGGAICMELLTPDGWSSAYSVESAIMQISSTLTRGGARINFTASRAEYSYQRALHAYKHLVQYHKDHGWYTPPSKEG